MHLFGGVANIRVQRGGWFLRANKKKRFFIKNL
jgi:hypothetical protein